MALPFLAAAIATYPVFLIMFRERDHIPRSIDVQGGESAIEPSSMLVDKWGAIFGSVLLIVTLGVLVGTSILDVPVWEITVPPAVIMFIRDVVYDWYTSRPAPVPESIDMETTIVGSRTSATVGVPSPRPSREVHKFWGYLTPSYLTSRFPTATTVLKRLPVALVPFALLTFVLVQGLTRRGWVELFANGWAWWASHTGVIGITAGMGIVTCILCNVSPLCPCLYCCLTTALDMWYQHWGDHLRRSSSRSLDRSDGRLPGSKEARRCHLFARSRLELWGVHVYHLRFVGRAALEGYPEAKGDRC